MGDNYNIQFTGKKKLFSPVKQKLFERYITERYSELIGQRIRREYPDQNVHLDSNIAIYPHGSDINIDAKTNIMVGGRNRGTQELNFTTTYQDAIAYLILDLFKEIENQY